MFTKMVVFWNWYDDAIEYVTPQLGSIFLLHLSSFSDSYSFMTAGPGIVRYNILNIVFLLALQIYPYVLLYIYFV